MFIRIIEKTMNIKCKEILSILLVLSCCMLHASNRTKVYADVKTSELSKLKQRVDPILVKVERQPDWLYSRLQMYWKTHATDVFIVSEAFDHPGGERAPYPTVKFAGTRGIESKYNAPKTEELVPYDDDEAGNVTFINKRTGKKEKAHPAETGTNISSVNQRIMDWARDAARLYSASGDKRYAEMALGVFDTYMKGIYYRHIPIDMTNGHQQTLVGMQTFEVIHEDIIYRATEIYDRLRQYITKDRDIYEAAFKKWAENEIANGVPHNNWNLFQAKFIAHIALMLQDDKSYSDGKGKQYYLNYILNESSIRQWSIKRMADFGFDDDTAIWYESPGYSLTVLNEFADFANWLDEKASVDMFKEIPILLRAIKVSPEYMAPNRMPVGWGDTHPNYYNTKAFDKVIAYAKRHNDRKLLAEFEELKRAILPTATDALISKYTSKSFYAPNVSWLAIRTGMNPQHDLMLSLNGSLGNHSHANGISMELYGKGYMLGPDAGIGKYLYSGLDYQEYYSQFPAHNTVCVDGISSYPVMMSSHPFRKIELDSVHSVVEFIEPESYARQQRVNGVVKTSATGGYYIDIFRSKKIEGGDKTHDYFYHNLGQTMNMTDANNKPLDLHPTDELAFAGGHLYAYSYIYNKACTEMTGDVKASFKIDGKGETMTMWMKADENRTIFKALSPANMEYERMPHEPYDIEKQPVLTFIARQRGEAWCHPFVCLYEPTTTAEPSEIKHVKFFTPKSTDKSAVGIEVELQNGHTHYIFSASESGVQMTYKDMIVKDRFAIIKK